MITETQRIGRIGSMKVIALHKVPFDPQKFEQDLLVVAGAPEYVKEFRPQVLENWNNSWYIVVEWPGGEGDVDWNAFEHQHKDPRYCSQAAWEELFLGTESGVSRGMFFMHYVDTSQPLMYGAEALSWPETTPAPPELVKLRPYCAPD